jgi:hypothetical protein
VRRQLIRVGFVALAALASAVTPAFAQAKPGDVAVGLSVLGDQGGLGLQATLARKIKDLEKDRILQWVGDVSFHHNSYGISDLSSTSFLVQGGARVRGAVNDKTDWFAHGLIGIRHFSFSSDLTDALCKSAGVDCGASSTGLIVTPGGGIDYAFSDSMQARVQLDIPIGDGGSTTRFMVGLVWKK